MKQFTKEILALSRAVKAREENYAKKIKAQKAVSDTEVKDSELASKVREAKESLVYAMSQHFGEKAMPKDPEDQEHIPF